MILGYFFDLVKRAYCYLIKKRGQDYKTGGELFNVTKKYQKGSKCLILEVLNR